MALSDEAHVERIPVIDSDVHTSTFPTDPAVKSHLPRRWLDYIEVFGFRGFSMTGDRPRQRPMAARLDAWEPGGALPGSNPEFVRTQLLDRYDLSGAVMNDIAGFLGSGGRAYPDDFAVAICRAYNDYRAQTWLASDDRWYGSISVPYEVDGAEEEIRRCRESSEFGERWVQVLLAPDNEKPAGHQRYWPIYEACEHYDIPATFHVLNSRALTGTGTPNYYFEEHTQFADYNFPIVSSLIFEGVFERFPKLKIGLVELAWSWMVPYTWRLDRAYEMLRGEVAHLPRKPSEYAAEHFWFSTQPMEEPERLEWFDDVYQLLEDTLGHRLMYSSDYPHWDFDEPTILPATLSIQTRRRILGENASDLYRIPLRANSGLAVELAGA
jgi:predicted TIM-barrel fold metal-dependent hydrolase